MKSASAIALMMTLVTFGAMQSAVGQDRSADQAISTEAAAPATAVLDSLNAAWNAADGAAFAAQFTEDADVININGTHFRGQAATAKQMQLIFDTIFKGSKHASRSLEAAHYLTDDMILAVSSAVIEVPNGPLAPEARSRQTFLLVRDENAWKIRHWHNTPIRPERISAPAARK